DSSIAYKVKRFVEKPDLDTAKLYLSSNDYYWNSGMFLFRAKRYLEELSTHRPDILAACQQAMAGQSSDSSQNFIRVDKDSFMKCPDESIDYAVMEKTSS
ncbi:TPA: mannose-1-phosphate guanylyltransferase/mannose-6-phosphate isomerase, partial [Escherichia coli]|nr:mannose-1-phosphate guanylyltransferase/mannose-6-phosphate isomerase [Escherichia coli]